MPQNEAENVRDYGTLIMRMALIAILTSITPMILVSGVILYQFRAS